ANFILYLYLFSVYSRGRLTSKRVLLNSKSRKAATTIIRRKACFISVATSFLHFFIAAKPHTSPLSTL
ncbi:MAG: hypothetical protein ACI4RP_07845, partial [Acutalibacteraceae bacterium]